MADVRQITIPRGRLAKWLAGFENRHGAVDSSYANNILLCSAADGAQAEIEIAFGDLEPDGDLIAAVVQQVLANRRVGAILARKGGYAVGIFEGDKLITSKVGSSYVQGKTKAGGWSQQRYARRRDNQSKKAYAEAADVVAQLLTPAAASLESIAVGGDKAAIAAVLADPRLENLRALVGDRVHPTPDPRLKILQAFPEQFLAVQIRLTEPEPPAS